MNFFLFFQNPEQLDRFRQIFPAAMCMIGASFHILWRFRKDEYHMQKIPKEYLLLFNAITDAEESLHKLRANLMEAQRRAEDLYIAGDDSEARLRKI